VVAVVLLQLRMMKLFSLVFLVQYWSGGVEYDGPAVDGGQRVLQNIMRRECMVLVAAHWSLTG
jgi:hypothetical protein